MVVSQSSGELDSLVPSAEPSFYSPLRMNKGFSRAEVVNPLNFRRSCFCHDKPNPHHNPKRGSPVRSLDAHRSSCIKQVSVLVKAVMRSAHEHESLFQNLATSHPQF